MKPIRALYNYKKNVAVDPENPKHKKFIGFQYATEERSKGGFVTDILKLEDAYKDRVLDGVSENGIPQHKEAVMQKSGVYVVFWEDCGEFYKMRILNFSDITVTSQEMRNYVNRFYTA